MTLTIIETPYAGDIEKNTEYAKRAMRDSIERGEFPLASHLIYPLILDERKPEQRSQGIALGYEWGKKADKIACYTDYGTSEGMQRAMAFYHKCGIEIEYRKIGKNADDPISIVVFKWGKPGYRTQFTEEHVNRFFRMVDRHVTIPYRKICITDDQRGIDKSIETFHLWPNPCPRYGNDMKPNCFYRLKMFDPEVKKIVGNRFVWMDLDAVIVRNINSLLCDTAEFKMWRVDNEFMPCNGSFMLHKTGTRAHIWNEFNPQKIHPVTGLRAHGFIGSDQAYIATKMTPKEKENTFGQKDGIYSFRCYIQKHKLTVLPDTVKIIFFHGRSNPWNEDVRKEYPWAEEAMLI